MSPASKIHFKSRTKKDTDLVGFPPSFSSILITTNIVDKIVESKAWFFLELFVALAETAGLSLIVGSLFSNAFRPNPLYVFIPFAISIIVCCITRVLALLQGHAHDWGVASICPWECILGNTGAFLGIFSVILEVLVLFAKLALFFRYTFSYQSILNDVYAKTFLIQFDAASISEHPLFRNFNFFIFDCTILAVCIAFELLEGYYLIRQLYLSFSVKRTTYSYNRYDAYASWMAGFLGYSYLLVLTLIPHSQDAQFFTNFFKYLPWLFLAVTTIRYFSRVDAFYYNPKWSLYRNIRETLRITAIELFFLVSAIFTFGYQFIHLKTTLQIIFMTLIVERFVGAFHFVRHGLEYKMINRLDGGKDDWPFQAAAPDDDDS